EAFAVLIRWPGGGVLHLPRHVGEEFLNPLEARFGSPFGALRRLGLTREFHDRLLDPVEPGTVAGRGARLRGLDPLGNFADRLFETGEPLGRLIDDRLASGWLIEAKGEIVNRLFQPRDAAADLAGGYCGV